MRIIDTHAHIFPDKIAAKATSATAAYFGQPEPAAPSEAPEAPRYHGTVQELSDAMERAGVSYALVFSAATAAHQVESIDRFILSAAQTHPKFLPCGTLHAGYEDFEQELRWMRENGMHGIKLHPEMQRFALNDRRLFPMFEEMAAHDMFLISHTGDPRVDVSSPERVRDVATTFPKLRIIAAHLGNWGEWAAEKVAAIAKLPNVYTDISSSFSWKPGCSAVRRCLQLYDPTHVFFGTDFPFWDPGTEVDKAGRIGFTEQQLEDVLFNNFAAFYHYKAL